MIMINFGRLNLPIETKFYKKSHDCRAKILPAPGKFTKFCLIFEFFKKVLPYSIYPLSRPWNNIFYCLF